MTRPKFSDSQIRAVLKQDEVSTAVADLCREHGISSATFYKGRAKLGGMDASLMTCNDPPISYSGVMFPTETAHECRDGRRDQALEGASEVSSGS